MKTVNIHEAKTNLSKILAMVQNGEEVVIAKAGVPIVDLKPHEKKQSIVFGSLRGKITFNDADFMGIDPEISELFYGKD